MATKSRKDIVAEWESKGAEWCAKNLWLARNVILAKLKDYELKAKQQRREEAEAIKLNLENKGLKEILKKTGIKLKHLRITYELQDCPNCEHYGYDVRYYDEVCGIVADYDWLNEEEDCKIIKCIDEFSVWTFSVEDDKVNMILADFSEKNLTVLKIVDEETNEIIFEKD